MYCWGDNAHGQLGINSTVATSLPVEVQLPANARAMSISAGSQHTCVVTTDGKLYCWGDSSNQQLGEYFLANSSGYVEETFLPVIGWILPLLVMYISANLALILTTMIGHIPQIMGGLSSGI